MAWFQYDIQKQINLTFTPHILYDPPLLLVILLFYSLWSMSLSSSDTLLLFWDTVSDTVNLCFKTGWRPRLFKHTQISDALTSVISHTASGHRAKSTVAFCLCFEVAMSDFFFFFFVTTTECGIGQMHGTYFFYFWGSHIANNRKLINSLNIECVVRSELVFRHF